MDKEDAIIRLLTEIRDNLCEETTWRKKVIEDSVRLQQLGVRRQLLGLAIGGLAIVAAVGILIWLLTH